MSCVRPVPARQGGARSGVRRGRRRLSEYVPRASTRAGDNYLTLASTSTPGRAVLHGERNVGAAVGSTPQRLSAGYGLVRRLHRTSTERFTPGLERSPAPFQVESLARSRALLAGSVFKMVMSIAVLSTRVNRRAVRLGGIGSSSAGASALEEGGHARWTSAPLRCRRPLLLPDRRALGVDRSKSTRTRLRKIRTSISTARAPARPSTSGAEHPYRGDKSGIRGASSVARPGPSS